VYRFVFLINGKLIDVVTKKFSRALIRGIVKYLKTAGLKGVNSRRTLDLSIIYVAKLDPHDMDWREKLAAKKFKLKKYSQ
jgi:hypothetical protein